MPENCHIGSGQVSGRQSLALRMSGVLITFGLWIALGTPALAQLNENCTASVLEALKGTVYINWA